MKNLIREEIDTNRPILLVMREYVDGNGILSDHRFSIICEVFDRHEDSVMEDMAGDSNIDRVADGFIFYTL